MRGPSQWGKQMLALDQHCSLQGSSKTTGFFFSGEFSLSIIPVLSHTFFKKAIGNYRLNGTERQTFSKLNLKEI